MGREPCSVLSCSPTCSVIIIVCSPTDTLVIHTPTCVLASVIMYSVLPLHSSTETLEAHQAPVQPGSLGGQGGGGGVVE